MRSAPSLDNSIFGDIVLNSILFTIIAETLYKYHDVLDNVKIQRCPVSWCLYKIFVIIIKKRKILLFDLFELSNYLIKVMKRGQVPDVRE